MKPEAALWRKFQTYLKGRFRNVRITRIENGAGLGTPDVHFTGDGYSAWIELKVVPKPVREDTVVHVDHFTTEQKLWLFSEQKCGGNALLLLQVGDDYLLFNGDVAGCLVGYKNLCALKTIALWHGKTFKGLL